MGEVAIIGGYGILSANAPYYSDSFSTPSQVKLTMQGVYQDAKIPCPHFYKEAALHAFLRFLAQYPLSLFGWRMQAH